MTDNNDLYELEPISDETTLCNVEPIETDQSSFGVEIAKDFASGFAYGAAIIGGQIALLGVVAGHRHAAPDPAGGLHAEGGGDALRDAAQALLDLPADLGAEEAHAALDPSGVG